MLFCYYYYLERGNFYGIEMVAALTPGQKANRIIPRHNIPQLNMTENIRIEIRLLRLINKICDILLQDLTRFLNCDVLWEKNDHPGQSSIVFLPIIDMYSGDRLCILSTLEYVSNVVFKHHVSPVITFDQPLR